MDRKKPEVNYFNDTTPQFKDDKQEGIVGEQSSELIINVCHNSK